MSGEAFLRNVVASIGGSVAGELLGLVPRLIKSIARWIDEGWGAISRRVRNTDINIPGLRRPVDVCSFSDDTLVSTIEGKVPIRDVETGDIVYAYNEATGEVGEYEVTHTHVHNDPAIAYVTINGELIKLLRTIPSTRLKAGRWVCWPQP